MRTIQLFVAASLAVIGIGFTSAQEPVRAAYAQGATRPDLARAQALFARQCAVCHGAAGAGDGTAAYLLSPAPRDFTTGRFRLSSTQNGVPTDTDLVATLRRGMPGSSMPPFDWMPEADLSSLAAYVRRLAVEGKTKSLLARAKADEEELPEKEAREIAEAQLAPGPPIDPGAPPPGDPVSFQEGRRSFLKTCALCHAADGTGRGSEDQKNEDGSPTRPRDFTAGVFKGGSSASDIVTRLRAGMSGSPMPAMSFDDPADAWKVARFVESLVKPGAQERVAQHRRQVRVRRVKGELPHDASSAAWRQAEGTWLAVAPLWWRDDRIEGLVLRALHDGTEIALRLSWEDATKDDEILGQDVFPDAVGIQLSVEREPPVLSMGAKGEPVNIWMWKAAWERDLERTRDIADYRPNTPPDFYGHVAQADEAMYLTADAVGNAMSIRKRATAGERLTAEGFGTVAPIVESGQKFLARGSWTDGFWDVVFTRSMESGAPNEIALRPGTRTFLGCALWDGSHQDRNGQKSVTVWHLLEIDP